MKNKQEYCGFDVGPIRPPSEAYSMLLRLTRGCSWNKCKFCSFYRNQTFAIRPVAHVKNDIDEIKSWVDVFQGKGAKVPRTQEEYEAYSVAVNWYQGGMKSVFLQDGNSLLVRPAQLMESLEYLNQVFPDIERITTYARSDAIARVSDEELRRYAALKLNRFHVGMETGNDELLKLVNKGVDKQTQIMAGQKAVRAGIEVSEFYMPGLGGREYAAQSAIDTADAINQINPHFVRIRCMALSDKLDLYEDYEKGIFTRTNDIDNILEIRTFLAHLEGIDSIVESDHILNILLELKGKLPGDKPRLLQTIDRFLSLPEEEQRIFRFGRRINAMSQLADLQNPGQVQRVQAIMEANGVHAGNIDQVSNGLMVNAIPIYTADDQAGSDQGQANRV